MQCANEVKRDQLTVMRSSGRGGGGVKGWRGRGGRGEGGKGGGQ